jgi:N-acetylneuraminic acid mutarotase
MKKILLPFVVVIACLVSATAIRAISATTGSAIAASPPGSISTRYLVQIGDNVIRAPNQVRTLTFAERVTHQRSIEEVYWRHRIWPKERPEPKPSLDAIMTQAQLEKKVTDYLRNSQALADYRQSPITAGQLQAEMNRMAQHTRQPEVLREVFEALGNDPFVIAECLARPLLADRLITHSVADQVKEISRISSEIAAAATYTLPTISDEASGCTDDTWTATSITNAPTARLYHTAVWTGSEVIVWGGFLLNTGGRYNPSTDSWTATSMTNAPTARAGHTAIWTGSEMIVWGGTDYTSQEFNTGGRYNPSTDSWTATSTTNPPVGRFYHTAVWTGSEMIVWGGIGGTNRDNLNTGGRYDPSTDSWTATSLTNTPTSREGHRAIWTGSEMIVWGGIANGNPYGVNTGGRYNPGTDSWTTTSLTNAPTARAGHTAVWTGSEMVVWGGLGVSSVNGVNTGGRYDPGTNSWTLTSTTGAPVARFDQTAVWTGSEMIVWGGYAGFGLRLNTGGRYNPSTDSWISTSTTNAPTARVWHTAVWTGSEMVVWGGRGSLGTTNTGGRYCVGALPAQLGNISTRAFVQTGDHVLIGGFIVQGTEPKRVIIRAIGPELSQHGVPNALVNPTLELHDHTGALIASNDDWATTIIGGIITANQVRDIQASGYAPHDGRESAIIADLPPGNYTAIVRGVNNTTGVALAEVYDLSNDASSILGNISTRAFVQTGDNVMIGGFMVQGAQPKRVIIRAMGPELIGSPYNIPDAMVNPTLELHDGTGALIASNDNWATTIIGGIITSNQFHDIVNSGYAPADGRESAIIAELPPGSYTAIVRGVNSTTGVALVEAYDLD